MSACQNNEVWDVVTFCSERACGNPTGVVFPDQGCASEHFRLIAMRLGFPDTAFLTPTGCVDHWVPRSFSPSEQVNFCIQTLIAANAVLRRRIPELEEVDIRFTTDDREVWTGALPGSPSEIGWLKLPEVNVKMDGLQRPIAWLGSAVAGGNFPAMLLDSGRRRLYQRVASEGLLHQLDVAPARARELCSANQVQGLCLFSCARPGAMALRVFTTSLDGGEDAATGGAVAGLLAYLAEQEPGLLAGNVPWEIQQGSGGFHRRGTLYLRRLPEDGLIAVGGKTRFVAVGKLCWPEVIN